MSSRIGLERKTDELKKISHSKRNKKIRLGCFTFNARTEDERSVRKSTKGLGAHGVQSSTLEERPIVQQSGDSEVAGSMASFFL